MSGYAADRNDFLACVGASDSRVLFGNTVRNTEKRDTTLLFVFVNRYYDDSRRITTIPVVYANQCRGRFVSCRRLFQGAG